MSAWLPKVVEPSKQQVLAAVFFLILYPYYLIRDKRKSLFNAAKVESHCSVLTWIWNLMGRPRTSLHVLLRSGHVMASTNSDVYIDGDHLEAL